MRWMRERKRPSVVALSTEILTNANERLLLTALARQGAMSAMALIVATCEAYRLASFSVTHDELGRALHELHRKGLVAIGPQVTLTSLGAEVVAVVVPR